MLTINNSNGINIICNFNRHTFDSAKFQMSLLPCPP